ncbi:MFS transporter [Lysobacter sp. GCM10012299]|uniref:MFS transporter n=1 Tax=Lysobacter sp. GCM10012299 TaxID=3317333 RepID=UPI003617040F
MQASNAQNDAHTTRTVAGVDTSTMRALAGAAVVMGLGQTTLLTFLPMLMQMTGLSLPRVTTAFALGSGLFLIGAPFWSRCSDAWGRRRVVVIALCGFALSHGLLLWQLLRHDAAWSGHFALLLAGRVLYGLTVSGLVPTCQAWLADVSSPSQRLRMMSRFSAGLALGRLIGPVMAAGSLALGWLGPVWLVALAPWPALLLLARVRKPMAHDSPSDAAPGSMPWRALVPWLLMALLMQASLGQVQYAVGPWLQAVFALTPTRVALELGWMLSACAALMIVLQLWVVPRCRPGRAVLMVGATALVATGVAFALAPLLPAMLGIWSGFGLLAVASALLVPTYSTLASFAAGGNRQSRAAAALAMTHTCGFSLAAVVAAGLFGLTPAAPFWAVALLGCVSVAIAVACDRPVRAE